MADLNLIVSQIRQRLEILYQEIDKIESGGGVSPEDAYTKEQADALFVKKVAGKGLSTNDFTDAYMNQIGTNATNITNLTSDVNSIFEQEGFSAAQGATLPTEIASVLAKHRPFFMNGRTWYFLSESGGILDYFAIDKNTNGYPELHYARIQESNRNLTVLKKFGTDTTPIQNSENFITSGGVYDTKTSLETLISAKATVSDVYGLGTTIESGTDLDSLTSVGVYNCLTNAIAATLSNCPTVNGFRLEVVSTISDTSYQIQRLYPNNSNGEFFMRRRVADVWSSWTKFSQDGFLFSIGTALNADDDLNNYTTVGRYYAGVSVSPSVTNKPVESNYGFELVVEQNAVSTRVIQTITYNTSNALHIGKIYKRWYTSDGWSEWYVYEGTAIVAAAANQLTQQLGTTEINPAESLI